MRSWCRARCRARPAGRRSTARGSSTASTSRRDRTPASMNCCGIERAALEPRHTDMNWAHLFFGFDGRISRKPYWIGQIVLVAAAFVSLSIELYFANDRLGAIINLALLYPTSAVLV